MSFNYETPEGMMGALLALEGIKDGCTIVHGPTGCKYCPSSSSEFAYTNRSDNDPQFCNPYRFFKKYYFGQPRIPCTYLQEDDYIMGASEKLTDLSDIVKKDQPSFIGIVNSPGTSLIGEDVGSITSKNIPILGIETPGYSESQCIGYQRTIISILNLIKPERIPKKDTVNILGLSISHLNWEDDLEEMTSMLDICGISVCQNVGTGWDTAGIRRSADAELNVMMFPEYGDDTADWYERTYGIPYLYSDSGAPIGFKAVEDWISRICKALDKDPAPALNNIKEKRTLTAKTLLDMEAQHRLPTGRTFSVEAEGSMAYAITEFLYSYLGMIPVAIHTDSDSLWNSRIQKFVSSKGLTVSDDVFNTPADVTIGSGNMISAMMMRKMTLGGVDVTRPCRKMVKIEKEPIIGLSGTMRLLDQVLNILWPRN